MKYAAAGLPGQIFEDSLCVADVNPRRSTWSRILGYWLCRGWKNVSCHFVFFLGFGT
jgi:hypothetical protein